MHIVIISAAFPPEPLVSGQTSYQIAIGLVERGHRVTVLAPFPNRPAGKLYPGYQRKLFDRQKDPIGFNLIHCFSTFSHSSTFYSRFLENITFGLSTCLALLSLVGPDIIFSNSWPIFATGLTSLVAGLRRLPLVISIQDIYPESLIVQGRISPNHWLIVFMRWLDKLITQNAAGLHVISERFAQIYIHDRGIPPEKVHLIPNWLEANPDVLDIVDTNTFRASLGITNNHFLVVFGGNIGTAAGLETIINCFARLKDTPNIHLLVAGEGSRLEYCKTLAEQTAPGQITFYSPWPVEATQLVYQSGDILILPTLGKQSLASQPSKLINYMLSGRPILVIALRESDLAQIVAQSGCGWVIEPEQTEQIADKIRELANLDPAELKLNGEAGRSYAMNNLTSKVCLPKILDIIEGAKY